MSSAHSVAPTRSRSDASRFIRYIVIRATTLLATVVLAVDLTILIANFGGQIDAFV